MDKCPLHLSDMYSEKRKIGNFGEDLAVRYLLDNSYILLDRNYLKKWGELDIVAKKDEALIFIEVKSKVSRESDKYSNNYVSRTVSQNSFTINSFKILISRENDSDSEYRPEENVHFWKQKRMVRAIETYILEKNIENEWQIDVITVGIDFSKNEAIIKHIENVIFDI